MKTCSDTLADFAAGLTFEDLPRPVVARAKLLILDVLGISLASTTLPYSRMMAEMVRRWGGLEESTVVWFGDRVPAPNAALVNGTLAHGLDFDDTHTGSITHASCCVVPPALAVGEVAKADGRALITAAVIGYEAISRIGMAAPGKFHDGGYHATPLCGTFAAALVAGKLLKAGAEPLASALGICGSQAAGIQEFLFDGSWTKRLHPGWAGHSGIIAAELASLGFKGPRRVFEGPFGLYSTHLGKDSFSAEALTSGLGEAWETLEISIKPYPCCHFNHSFMDAALELRKEEGFSLEKVEEIECRVPEPIVHIVCEPAPLKAAPPAAYAALFSLPYCVAVVLQEGRARLEEFSEERIRDPRVLGLAKKVTYSVDHAAQFPKYFPGWVRVKLRGGKVLERKMPINRGHPENQMSPEEVKAKFRGNATKALPLRKVEAIAEAIGSLESLDRVSDLMGLLQREE